MARVKRFPQVLLFFALAMVALGFTGDCINHAPELADPGDVETVAGQAVVIELIATDPDGDELIYYADGLPDGATFDDAAGVFEWTPGFFQLGEFELLFGVTDGDKSDEESVIVDVKADTDFVEIVLDPNELFLVEGGTATINVVGVRDDGTLVEGIFANLSSGDSTVADVDFLGDVTGVADGETTIEAWLIDPAALTASASVRVGFDTIIINGITTGVGVFNTASGAGIAETGATAGIFPNGVTVYDGEAYVIVSFDSTIVVLDTQTLAQKRVIDVSVDAANPWALVIASGDKAYVSGLITDKVAIFDPQTGASLGAIDMPLLEGIGATPASMLLDGDRLFVSCNHIADDYSAYGTGFVAVIDTTTDTLIDTDGDASNGVTPIFTTQYNPNGLAIVDGKLFVACTGDFSFSPGSYSHVNAFDAGSYALLADLPLGDFTFANSLWAAPNGKVYANDGLAPFIYSLDASSLTLLRSGTASTYIVAPNAGGFPFVPDAKFKDGHLWGVEFASDTIFAFDLAADNDVDPVTFTTSVDLTPDPADWSGTQWFDFLN